MNDRPAATTQTATGAPKAKRRRASSGSTTQGTSGTAIHGVVPASSTASWFSAASSRLSIAAMTISRSKP